MYYGSALLLFIRKLHCLQTVEHMSSLLGGASGSETIAGPNLIIYFFEHVHNVFTSTTPRVLHLVLFIIVAFVTVVIIFSLLYLHTEVFSDTPLSVCILNVSKYCCPSILALRVLHFGAIHLAFIYPFST